jgi:hypothetical protein
MRRIPIDSTKVRFISTGKAAGRPKYAELSDGSRKRVPDSQDTDDRGVPLWTIDCLSDGDDGDRAVIASVKVASYEVPEFRLGEEVRFVGLVAVPYINGNRVAISYQAEALDTTTARKPEAVA